MPQKKVAARTKRASAKTKSRPTIKKIAGLEKTVIRDLKSTGRKAAATAKKLWRSAEDLVTSKKKPARKKRASAR